MADVELQVLGNGNGGDVTVNLDSKQSDDNQLEAVAMDTNIDVDDVIASKHAPAFDLLNSFMERSDHKRTFDIILLQYPQASIFNNCLYVCR